MSFTLTTILVSTLFAAPAQAPDQPLPDLTGVSGYVMTVEQEQAQTQEPEQPNDEDEVYE